MVDIKASGNLQASAAEVSTDPIDLARGYLGVVRRLLPAIDVLAQSTEKVVYGLAMLTAHSLECALKAYLAHIGMSEDDLRSNFGHNIEQLGVEAAKNGLRIEPQPPIWCVKLNSLHNQPFHLRYPKGTVLVIPEVSVMILGLKSVIDAVTECVGQ